MATSKEFMLYAAENIQRAADNIRIRPMMGEYLVYFEGKLIGYICDNQFLVKITPSVDIILENPPKAYPYEASKTLMAVVEELENTELLSRLISVLASEL